jgi:hypothetical protein
MDIKSDSATAGKSPEINPTTTLGRSSIHPRKVTFVVRNLTFDIIPTIAAGRDQKMTIRAIKAVTMNCRRIFSHQYIRRDGQTIS